MPECHQRIGVPQPPKGRGSWTDQPCIECRVADPVLTPKATPDQSDQEEPITTDTLRPVRKARNHNRGQPTTPNDVSRCSKRMPWSTVSKAAVTSNKARSVTCPLSSCALELYRNHFLPILPVQRIADY